MVIWVVSSEEAEVMVLKLEKLFKPPVPNAKLDVCVDAELGEDW